MDTTLVSTPKIKSQIVFQIDVIANLDCKSYQVRRFAGTFHVGRNETKVADWPTYTGYQQAEAAALAMAGEEALAMMVYQPKISLERVTALFQDGIRWPDDKPYVHHYLRLPHNQREEYMAY